METLLHTLSTSWIYIVVAMIVLLEIGVLPFFFLPGDSLLFTVGMFASGGAVSVSLVVGAIFFAACIGNGLGYFLGYTFRNSYESKRFFKKIPLHYIQKTERFYDRYGVLTIVVARFVPVVRTVAPFLAGVGKMNRRSFFLYSVFGALLWVVAVVGAGFVFGEHVVVKNIEKTGIFIMLAAVILVPLVLFVASAVVKKNK